MDIGSHHDHTAHLHAMGDLPSSPSSPDSNFDESDLFNASITDEVTAQLIAAGTVGVAAAAAIATGRKRKRPHAFETNPSIRKRQQNRLLRKLKATIDEYTTRVGQQAVILTCMPGKHNQSALSYKVFGSQPLENVVRGCKGKIMQELEQALVTNAPFLPDQHLHSGLHELPPLHIDGIPTPVDKMTQAQLRAFIPEMLKFSTGRSKPGWGKPEYRPIWWPLDVPWANVRSDVRCEEMKKKVSWTHALKTVVRNCYKHHNREDLLPQFAEPTDVSGSGVGQVSAQHTMLQTISNPDGSMSIIQIDPGEIGQPQVITLPDGTQAQIVHANLNSQQTIENVSLGPTLVTPDVNTHHQMNSQMMSSSMDLNAVQVGQYTDATINSEGQLVLTGGADPSNLNGVVSIPMSMYQTVVGSIPNLGGQSIIISPQNLQEVTSQPDGGGTKVEAEQLLVGGPQLTHVSIKSDASADTVNDTNHIQVVTIDTSAITQTAHADDTDSDT